MIVLEDDIYPLQVIKKKKYTMILMTLITKANGLSKWKILIYFWYDQIKDKIEANLENIHDYL